MANQILENAYTYIGTPNLEFTRNRDRWQFLLDSYLGGDEYRNGGHLVKYSLETQGEYQARLRSTPLDNHCRSVISVYISFLFRTEPEREFGLLENDPALSDFLADADLDGRSFDAFMKETSIWASVFGHSWVLMTKPSIEAETLADQLAQGVRPYVNLLTPLVVTDWRWERLPNGRYQLAYFKYIEDVNDSVTTIREWTPDFIRTYEANDKTRASDLINEEVNELGKIPAVLVYNERSQVRGLGISDITDIADQQRAIYNELSEVEQSVRLEGHPSLVTTPDTQIGSGAGALIQMSENLDPGLKPYMLNADSTPINMIYESINNRVKMIDRMANTGSVRATETQTMSGIAMETEFQLLNAKLSEKADNLELAEEQLWNLYAEYQGQTWAGSVEYPGSFNLRDTGREVTQLVTAKSAATDPVMLRVIDEQLIELLGEEKTRLPFIDPNPQTGRTYPDGEPIADSLPAAYQLATNPDVPPGQNCGNCEYYKPGELYCTKFDAPVRAVFWCAKWESYEDVPSVMTAEIKAEIQQMIMTGMTNADIITAVPGITVEDIVTAAADAARNNN
jgi:hypothetical protein